MSELQPYDFKLVLHELREKLLCKITAIRNDDDSREHYRQAVDKSGQYMGVYNQADFMIIELESGYKFVIFDEPDCCAHHYFEIDEHDVNNLVGDILRGIITDAASHQVEGSYEDCDVTECQVMGIVTDKLMVRFHVYNGHNGYYGGIRPQLFILNEANEYLGSGDVPDVPFVNLLEQMCEQAAALESNLER